MVRPGSVRGDELGLFVQAPIDPGDHVPDLKTGVLDPNRHPMLRPRPGEGQQMAARLQHAQALGPHLHAWHVVVPALAHEGQAVGRVGHDGIHAAVRQGAEHLQAVAVMQAYGFGHSSLGVLPVAIMRLSRSARWPTCFAQRESSIIVAAAW